MELSELGFAGERRSTLRSTSIYSKVRTLIDASTESVHPSSETFPSDSCTFSECFDVNAV